MSPFRVVIRITFASETIGRLAFQAAQSYTIHNALAGEYPRIYADKNKALLSRGKLPLHLNVTLEAHPEGMLGRWKNGEEAAGKAAGGSLVFKRYHRGKLSVFRGETFSRQILVEVVESFAGYGIA